MVAIAAAAECIAVDLFAVIMPGLPAASGYSVPAWDKLGVLSRIRLPQTMGRVGLELLTGKPTVHPGDT
jgi:hypothetical protein